jgi:hypothetical protein
VTPVSAATEITIPEQSNRGRAQDRAKVAGGQKHDVSYESKKTTAKPADVRAAVKKVGNSRGKVEVELKR